jgi:hypothetical protein
VGIGGWNSGEWGTGKRSLKEKSLYHPAKALNCWLKFIFNQLL